MSNDFGSGLRALVAESDAATRELVAGVLAKAGFTVEKAWDRETAGVAFARQRCDLAIVDRDLSGGGLALAVRLAADDVVVVMTTSHLDVTAAVTAMQHGIVDYLEKPLDRVELHARLARVVESMARRVANARAVADLRRKAQVLEGLVVRDPLTGLYSHAHFQESVEREILRSKRHGLDVALILVDIDGFKDLNDRHGHATGDAVLSAIGGILRGEPGSGQQAVLRAEDTSARYAADAFAVLLPATTKASAAAIAERLRLLIESSQGRGPLPPVRVSLGVAGYPADASNREALVHAAEAALKAAKRAGRNRVATFTGALLNAEAGLALEAAQLIGLERSLESRSFAFVFQPIMRTDSWGVFAYEALCRPRDPVFTSPLELFAAAERAGKISALGRALRQISLQVVSDLPEESLLFLNLHPHELEDPQLLDDPGLGRWASRIVFEITESAAIEDYARAREIIANLRARGFRVALDDLGAGYSGLNSLAHLGPDFVKLDMAMVRGLHNNSRSARLIKHVLEFANEESMRVIAEGIENSAELEAVVRLGVPLVQGFFLARPAAEFVTPGPPLPN